MRSDIHQINIQIERAEKLLADQEFVVARLKPHLSPHYAVTVRALTEIMEDRIVALYRKQRQCSSTVRPAHVRPSGF